jgi:hypothetical protein
VKLKSGVHLSYCTNIHPGESWKEVRGQLSRHLPPLRQRLCPDAPLGLGLRVSEACCRDLQEPSNFEELVELLRRTGSYVFTVNGFPYGQFHGERVKERVYLPDWSSEERLDYTRRIGGLLVGIADAQKAFTGASAPDTLSVSTVPGGFRRGTDTPRRKRMALNLARAAAEFSVLLERFGVTVQLAVEPEPACVLETTEECVRFLEQEVFGALAQAEFREAVFSDLRGGVSTESAAVEKLRRHLGI